MNSSRCCNGKCLRPANNAVTTDDHRKGERMASRRRIHIQLYFALFILSETPIASCLTAWRRSLATSSYRQPRRRQGIQVVSPIAVSIPAHAEFHFGDYAKRRPDFNHHRRDYKTMASQHFKASVLSCLHVTEDRNGRTLNHDTSTDKDEIIAELQRENELLKRKVNSLESENHLLHVEMSNRIVLETFEGGGKTKHLQEGHQQHLSSVSDATSPLPSWGPTGYTTSIDESSSEMWCDELDDNDSCPVEPMVSFVEALRDRAMWLVGLLFLQSCSGLILSHNEALLTNHPVIIYFLTMLVGAGGNAGNQASVRVIRGLALGTLNSQTQNQFLLRELKMAMALSVILSATGFIRAAIFATPLLETLAVAASLALIVFSSVCLGAILPLILKRVRVDPAHSSTTIQVVMDILGVILAIFVSRLFLESPLGSFLISRLGA